MVLREQLEDDTWHPFGLEEMIPRMDGWEYLDPREMNDNGLIVGTAWFTDPKNPQAERESHGFALVPLGFHARDSKIVESKLVEPINQGFDPLRQDDGYQMELHDALENFRSIKPERLRDPKNARLLEQLRIKARDEYGLAARVLLLRVDDETVVQACLERLRSPHGALARGEFELAGNPKLIAALAPDFNREETAVFVWVGGDQIKYSAPSPLK